jgi:hypothetical protein
MRAYRIYTLIETNLRPLYNLLMKNILIISTIFIGLNTANAAEIKISYSHKNDLILSAKSCQNLISQHQAICQWKKLIDPKFSLPEISSDLCRKSSDSNYHMTITSCLPDFVKNNQHKKLFKDGANCWGTAMNLKGISSKPRFMWTNEMTYWLNSPLCRKLNPGEKKMPGDLINVYGPEYVFQREEESNKGNQFWEALFPGRLTPSFKNGYSGFHHFLHTETFISDEISFGKDSPAQDDKFEFHPTNEIYGRPRGVECQENQSMEPYSREYQNSPKSIKGSTCDYFSLAYRCENFTDYFAKINLTSNDLELLDDIKELQKSQQKLFLLMTDSKNSIYQSELNVMLRLADMTATESLGQLSETGLDKNREMLITLKYFTSSGIRKSLELAELIPPTEEL